MLILIFSASFLPLFLSTMIWRVSKRMISFSCVMIFAALGFTTSCSVGSIFWRMILSLNILPEKSLQSSLEHTVDHMRVFL